MPPRPVRPFRHRRLAPLVTATAALLALAAARGAAGSPTAVTALDWAPSLDGTTVVAVTTAGELEPADYRAYGVPSPPRVVVVVRGIDRPMTPRVREIADGNLHRVRSGLHQSGTAPELHLVFDLVADDVELLELSHAGRRLRAVFGRRSPAPAASPSVPWQPTPTPTPTPTTTPTPPLEPTASATAAEPVAGPAVLATPAPGFAAPAATHVTGVSVHPRGDGSSLLLITADGPLDDGCARVLEVADEPARIVVTLRGLSAPGLPRTVELGDPLVERVRVIHDAETSSAGELHLLLLSSDGAVTVTDLRQVGANLVLRLARPGSPPSEP